MTSDASSPRTGVPRARRPFQLSSRAYLLILVAAPLLPILVFAGLVLNRFTEGERARYQNAAQYAAERVAAAVDRELASLETAIQALATGRSFGERAYDRFYERALEVKRIVKADVLLKDAQGQQLLNTRAPFGATLPASLQEHERRAIALNRPQVSDLFVGALAGGPTVSVTVPIARNGTVNHLLTIAVSPDRLREVLRSQALAERWRVAIIDRNGATLAGSRSVQPDTGEPGALPDVPAGSRSGATRFLVAYARPQTAPEWRIAVGVPVEVAEAPLRRALAPLAAAGALALFVSAAAAIWMGRQASRGMRTLAHAAAGLGAARPVEPVRSSVREINLVGAALAAAARDLDARDQERRRAEEALRRETDRLAASEAELARVQRIGGVAGVDVDLTGGFRNRRSPDYLRLHGLPPESADEPHEAWVARLHPDHRGEDDHFRAAIARGDRLYEAEYRIVRPLDGEVRWIGVKAEIERDPEGRPLRFLGAHIDITQRKIAEEALRRLNENLEKAVEERSAQIVQLQKLEAIGQLTGGVAHDFNNILMVVLGSLELLRKRLGEDPRALKLLDNAVQGAERGAALTQRLLAFARRQELEPKTVDVAALVEGMSDLLLGSLGPQIELDLRFPVDLPPARVDPNQLELAILNLTVNGRDAIAQTGRIAIAARAERGTEGGTDHVVLSVADSGAGMDEETLRRATEPFFTTKGIGKGTGLGLSMVHGLAQQSHGRLVLHSVPGLGTTAELWLPQADAVAPAATPIVASAAASRPAEGQSSRTRILVVDDDPLVLAGTAHFLDDLGCLVVEASSGRQAIEILNAGARIDLVVTDYAMPGMTGLELIDRIKAAYPDLPTILATGFAELPEGALGATARLAKPYTQEALAAAVAVALAPSASSNVVAFARP